MREFKTTREFILSKTVSPTTSPTVKVSGYTSVGDGGEATWKFKGVTGQTPSQSPAQQQHNLM